jgi:hypothetical protein
MFESAPIPQLQGFNPVEQVSNLRIEKLLMFETGTYHPQLRRPYVATAQPGQLAAVHDRIAENGQGRITASVFGDAGLQFIAPSAQPESIAQIQNGWSERRFRFLMHVTYNRGSAFGQRFHEVLTGWTDRTDLTMQSHKVAPDMLFTINGVTHLKEIAYNNGAGMTMQYQVSDNSTLLGNPSFPIHGMAGHTDVSMRPMDVFSHMTLTGAEFGNLPADSRTTITDKAVKSKRANNNPNEYLSRLVDNMVNASTVSNSRVVPGNNEYHQDIQSPSDAVREARRFSAETMAIKDTVLRALQAQSMAQSPQVIFSYQALCAMDPTIDQRKLVQYSTPATPMVLHNPSMSNAWDGTSAMPTEPTHQAVILSLAIPAIMSDLGLTRLDFHATNHTFGAQFVITPSLAYSFVEGMDLMSMTEAFKQRLIHEVLNAIAGYGNHSVNLIVQADLAGETVINLSWDGYPAIDFVAASFADTLVAPVLTGQRAVLAQLTNGMQELFSTLDGMGQAPSPISGVVPGGFNPMSGFGGGGDI